MSPPMPPPGPGSPYGPGHGPGHGPRHGYPAYGPPPRPPSYGTAQAARGWAIAAFALGALLVVPFVGFAALTLLTGAPYHVQLTVFRFGYQVALVLVGVPAVLGLVLGIVALNRRPRPLTGAGDDGTRAAKLALVLAAVCLAAMLLSAPLLAVDPCMKLTCEP